MKEVEVLLLDDEIEIADEVADYLSGRGVKAIGLFTPAMLEDELGRMEKVRVVVTDLRMPGRSGFDFIRSIKEKFPDRRLSFVVMSGFISPEDVEAGRQLGVVDFLRKPVAPQELMDAILPLLRGS
ncbi:response regulator [Parvibaculum sedimenti]|uniref:Response regulator n=1 Tax=Parvibaculum sedimenti TaxID=2608632 RepID=A0A6N6VQB2_9HYPH|nr:response regulator [Parvibaculum sedimenti]KAB7741274.1 response regulator [Parvibaculum sedimenti]